MNSVYDSRRTKGLKILAMGNKSASERSDGVEPDGPVAGFLNIVRLNDCQYNAEDHEPLIFHQVHGSNIQLYGNGNIARRENSFCWAVSFSNRPVRVNEEFCFRIIESNDKWSGALRFGITNSNPLCMCSNLPKYVCPDLTSFKHTWAKGISDKYCKQGDVFVFAVNEKGEMTFAVNGKTRGVFLTGINVKKPMWIVVDVYGNCQAVELIKPAEPPARFSPSHRNVWLSEDRSVAGRKESLGFSEKSIVVIDCILRPGMILPIRILKLKQTCGALPTTLMSRDVNDMHTFPTPDENSAIQNRRVFDISSGILGNLKLFDSVVFYVDDQKWLHTMTPGGQRHRIMKLIGRCSLYFDLSCDISTIQICRLTESDLMIREIMVKDELLTAADRANSSFRHSEFSSEFSAAARRYDAAAFACSNEGAYINRQEGVVDEFTHIQDQNVRSSPVSQISTNSVVASEQSPSYRQISVALPPLPFSQTVVSSNQVLLSSTSDPTDSSTVAFSGNFSSLSVSAVPKNEDANASRVTTSDPVSNDLNQKANPTDIDEDECKICMLARVDCAFYPCGHYCMCYPCAKMSIERQNCCPICRKLVKDVIKIFKA